MPITTFSRTHIINKIINDNYLKTYLEIGVSNPYVNFLLINCPHKVSVDPCMACEMYSEQSIEQFKPFITDQVTSDDFFARNTEKFDLVFIDGDHSYEQSLKDLNNALKVIPVGGFVILHDAMPSSLEATQISNLGKGPYNGGVWATMVSAIRSNNGSLQIGTIPYDWGIGIVKKLSEDILEIPVMDLDYHKDYRLPALNPISDIREFYNQKVSFFTSLYNTDQKSVERALRSVLNQTNKNWEWVLVDDSNNDADAKRLEKYFNSVDDVRIKYFRFNHQSGGFIGRAKKRAADLCNGDYLAELDHDDILMPDIADKILKYGNGFDFIYSNCASVVVNDNESFYVGESYPAGIAMG